jgi:predicted RND superfamily exporter protein
MTKINKKIISFLFLAMAVVSFFVSSSITTNASDKYIDEDKNKNETIEKKVKKFKSKVPTEIENKTEFESSEKYNVYMQELEKIGKENKKDKEILNKIVELDKKFSQIKTRSIYSFYYMTNGEKWYYATHPWDIQFANNVVN